MGEGTSTESAIVTNIDSGVRSVAGYQAALHSQRADCLLFYRGSGDTKYFDSEEFEVITLAEDSLIWTCGSNFPLERLEHEVIPHLTYAPSSQLSELSLPLIRITPPAKRLSTLFQSTISESLLPMVIQGNGVACLPYSVAKQHIDEQRLVHIWQNYNEPLEIVLIRLLNTKTAHPDIKVLFSVAEDLYQYNDSD